MNRQYAEDKFIGMNVYKSVIKNIKFTYVKDKMEKFFLNG